MTWNRRLLNASAFVAVMLFFMALFLLGCDSFTPTSVTVVPTPTPVVATTPKPTPTPSVALPTDPLLARGFEVTWSEGACFSVKNLNTIPVELSTYFTSFDDQSKPAGGTVSKIIAAGAIWGHCWNLGCVEVDIDQPGVKPLGGYWFDVNQRPFNQSREPQKVAECRAPKPTPSPTATPTPQPTPTPSPCIPDARGCPPTPTPTPTPCPKHYKGCK